MTAHLRGAIAAGHPQTAAAGLEMFRLGGNAFDAAVAAVLAACVTEPTLTSLGGGGFLLAHTADNRNILFDFFTQTPRRRRPAAEVEFYPVEVNFGTAVQEFHIGKGAIAVPGTVAGLFHVQQRLGQLPLRVVAEPAIHYAKTGVPVGDFQAYCYSILSPILLSCPVMRPVYAPAEGLLQPGDCFYNPDMANTLAYLVETGQRGFYEGELAQQLVRDCQQGGHLTLEDLQQYRVIERSPLQATYRGDTFLTNPPPSSGGSLIAFSLALLSRLNLSEMGFGSPEHVRSLVQAMQLTNLARADGYDAHLDDPQLAARFLAPEQLEPYAQSLLQTVHQPLDVAPINKWGSTTHLSVVDSAGNAASVTTSNGEGSAYSIPGTGVMLNNMLGEADLHPAGFHQWPENVRISSMMAPTIVLDQGRPALVLGSGGSNRIRTAILQVISNLVDFHMPLEAAVNSPRLHAEAGVLNLEPGLDLPSGVDLELVQWQQQNMFFGGVHAVALGADGSFSGSGDRRRSGAFLQQEGA